MVAMDALDEISPRILKGDPVGVVHVGTVPDDGRSELTNFILHHGCNPSGGGILHSNCLQRPSKAATARHGQATTPVKGPH